VADDQAREIPDEEMKIWMMEAQQVAVSGYHLVLEVDQTCRTQVMNGTNRMN
jgi:hypothetical protein